MKYYEDFLKDYLDVDVLKELKTVKDWKIFERNESIMKEYYEEGQFLTKLRVYLHSKKFIQWVEKESGIEGLVVDSYGIGEGVSLMEKEHKLNPHIDFNWNDRIKMHRAVNLMIYLGSASGGHFTMYDEDMNKSGSYEPIHNSAILFNHSETKAHGVNTVTSGQRYSIRQFYYKSEATCENPHQSLYWYNPNKEMPTNS